MTVENVKECSLHLELMWKQECNEWAKNKQRWEEEERKWGEEKNTQIRTFCRCSAHLVELSAQHSSLFWRTDSTPGFGLVFCFVFLLFSWTESRWKMLSEYKAAQLHELLGAGGLCCLGPALTRSNRAKDINCSGPSPDWLWHSYGCTVCFFLFLKNDGWQQKHPARVSWDQAGLPSAQGFVLLNFISWLICLINQYIYNI